MLAKTFRELKVWQLAYRLALEVYRLTAHFPKSEMFGLTSQLRRSSVSVVMNIAEGFKRRSRVDRLHFYNMAETSLEETKCGLLLARDLGYLAATDFDAVYGLAEECGRALNGWIAKN